MASSYIDETDITDSAIQEAGLATELTAKMNLVDDALEDMAMQKGVEDTDIETDPVHYLVKRWCVAWVCMELCFDMIGKNKDETEADIYNVKYQHYQRRLQDAESQINAEVLMGTADTQRERPGPRTGTIMIGG